VGPAAIAESIVSLLTPPAFVPRVPVEVGLRYRPERRRGTPPLADVYLPDGPGPHPSVLFVHGGGFLIGSRQMKPARFFGTRLAEAGFAVAACDYRKVFRGGRLSEAVDDVRAFMAWWGAPEQAARFHLDLDAVHTMGLSAGGNLMLLAAAQEPIPLRHAVAVFALYDLSSLGGRLPRILSRLVTRSGDRETWRARSPLAMPMPRIPLTVLHGTADRLTPVEQAHAYAARREAEGLKTRVHIYEGAPHGFFNDATAPVAAHGLADVLAAFRG
jgi:acetyl esterase/lipase